MIHLNNVVKEFQNGADRIVALDGISLGIGEGELVVLKGKSGSGKSTILSLIAALSKPTRGEIVVDGERIAKLSENFAARFRLHNIGFIFQRYNLFEQMSAYENILTPLVPSSLSKEEESARIEEVAASLEIESKLSQRVASLSGGEQQRVAIARALVNNPKIILADEPTANLDSRLSQNFIDLLKQLKSKNRTIIVATHDPLFFNLPFVDRIIEIEGGRVCS